MILCGCLRRRQEGRELPAGAHRLPQPVGRLLLLEGLGGALGQLAEELGLLPQPLHLRALLSLLRPGLPRAQEAFARGLDVHAARLTNN